ncbi:MAG TPA: tetratricopeptide repeat protein [bacterium]|nr:tetratricopeptide repeat protein [bacterium]
MVVLNQNYFSGWRVKGFPGAKAIFYRGKIGIPVPPGQHQLKVYFWPRTFIWGLSLTLLAIGLSLWFLIRPFRKIWFVIIVSILFVISGSYLLFGLQSPPQIQTIKQALDKEFAGDLEGAATDFKTALTYYPESYPVYHQLGLILTKLGRFPEAVRYYQKALQLWPHWQEKPYYFGLAFYHGGEFAEAIKSFREEIRRFPGHLEAINNLAWLLATVPQEDLRDGSEALRLAKRACEATGYNNPIFLNTLAAAYAETGRFEKAIQTAQEAIEKALLNGQKPLAEKIQKRLKMYQTHQPYRGYR